VEIFNELNDDSKWAVTIDELRTFQCLEKVSDDEAINAINTMVKLACIAIEATNCQYPN